MRLLHKIAAYKAYQKGVKHCTLDPEGEGVVRIHLIPPKFRWFGNAEYIVILNGYYLLPLGYSWAMLLSALMDEINAFDGKEISLEDEETILSKAVRRVHRIYPMTDKKELAEDLESMMGTLVAVAKGDADKTEIEKLSLRQYAKHMTAPHRMDLMISAMTDREGRWKCNQRCMFCYASGEALAKGEELSTEEWKIILDRCRQAHIPMVTFTGGEPTLRPDLCELLDYGKWFVTRLNTNGVLLTEDLARRLREASLDSVQITLYSYDEETHNSLVGSHHYQDTVNGIRHALAAGLDVSINTPLCKKNSHYTDTLAFLHSLGVRYVTASGLICTGTAAENHEEYDLEENSLFEIVRSAKEYCSENGMEIDFTSPGLIEKTRLEALGMNVPACGACLSNMAVSPNGKVIPCQSFLREGAALGDLLKEDFETIWKHPLCEKLRGMNEEEALSCPFRRETV